MYKISYKTKVNIFSIDEKYNLMINILVHSSIIEYKEN